VVLVGSSERRVQVDEFLAMISESSSPDASSRDFPLIDKSSIVLRRVSVIRSCVSSDPPRIENLSAFVILL